MSPCQARNASIQSSKVAIFFIPFSVPRTPYHIAAMAPEIDWEGLVVAFENRSHKITHFFDRQTGDVVQVLDRDAERHAALTADPRYAALPRDTGERSRGDLVDFASHCDDDACRRDLEAALG